jgi:beta-lactamase regulating signal transducer with metallopeptidase domain
VSLAMMAFDLHAIAETSATGIVDCLVLGTFVAALAALLLRGTRRHDAGTRFVVGFASLMAIAALPFVEAMWKAHRAGSSAAATSHVALTLPGSWAVYLVGTWAAFAVIASARVVMGLWHLQRIRRSCVPVDVRQLDAHVREMLDRKRRVREVMLCTSDQVQVPTVIGLFRPAVIVPGWALEELSPDELNQILIHELAHLSRWDDWTNLVQQIVKAFFFFQPAVWWIERRISLEREMACDDAVLAETGRPRAYAECLAHLAERSFMRRSIVLAQAVLGRVHQISRRVAQILDGNRGARASQSWKVAVPLVGVFAGASLVAAVNAPQLISFREPEASAVSTVKNAVLPDSGITAFSAPVIPAKLIASSGVNTHQIRRKKIERVRPQPGVEQTPQSIVAQNTPVQNRTDGMIHLASVGSAPVISTETVLVVFEGSAVSSNNQPAYQVRIWRLVLWHPASDVTSRRVSPKI